MSILNKFTKKKFIYIITIVIAAFSINYVIAEVSQGQHGYNATDLSFDADEEGLVLLNDDCGGLASLGHEATAGNKAGGSADLSFAKKNPDGNVNCIITIQRDITPSTDAGVPIGNDWIDIDISFFYRIFSLDSTILAHWGEVRLHEQACASTGTEIVKVEKDPNPTDAGALNFAETGTFVSHNPQGSAVLADLDSNTAHCMKIDLEIIASGTGNKDFQIFIDDIKIEFSNESKTKINHDFQQGFSFQ